MQLFGHRGLARLASLARSRQIEDRERDAISDALFVDAPGEFVPYVFRLATLMALSTVIATLGLIANSVAVVIGAMLVAPLMQPILAFSAGIVQRSPRRQLVALGLVAAATAEGLGVSAAVGLVVPSFRVVTLTPEILSRTAPALLDLAIAIAAGCAGAYVTVHRQSSGALPGAAIAVALIPPLAAGGLLLDHDNTSLAKGALLLFATNLLGIALAASAVFLLTGYVSRQGVGLRQLLGLLLPAVLVLGVAYPLGRRSATSYRIAQDEAQARHVLVPLLRAAGLGIQALGVTEQDGAITASVDVIGPHRAPPVDALVKPLADSLQHPTILILRWTKRDEQIAVSSTAP